MARNVYLRGMLAQYAVVLSLISVGIAMALVFWAGISLYLGWMLAVNVVILVLYRLDKQWSFRQGGFRVPNFIMLMGMLVGGVVGAYVGMHLRPRHKTNQGSYWFMLLLATLVHAYITFRLTR